MFVKIFVLFVFSFEIRIKKMKMRKIKFLLVTDKSERFTE